MRFYLIDGLRGLAATWVVLFHAYMGSHIDGLAAVIPPIVVDYLFRYGEAGVPVFFAISGFVISHSLGGDRIDGAYFAKFTLRRGLRLDPPYWASIALYLAVGWLSSSVKSEVMAWPTGQSVVAHMWYLQGFLGFKNINVVYWTLCMEIQFYLASCLLFGLVQRQVRWRRLVGVAVLAGVIALSLPWPIGLVQESPVRGLMLPHSYAFLTGVLAYLTWRRRVPNLVFYGYDAVILGFSLATSNAFGVAAAVTALVVHEAALRGRIGALNWPWLQTLGKVSYSLYLTHLPVSGAVFFATAHVLGDSAVEQLLALVINVLACVAFAYGFWWCFEKWSIRLSRRIRLHGAGAARVS